MAQLAIKGHETRGSEVIALLKMLGGTNKMLLDGNSQCTPYFIIENVISGGLKETSYYLNNDFKTFTLEEFEEKYPYKVGDKVTLDNKLCSIIWMCWECNNIYYLVQGIGDVFTKKVTTDELKSYKERNMKENKVDYDIKENIEKNQPPKTQADVDKYLQEHSVKNGMNVIDIETCLEMDGLKLPENVVINSKGIGSIQFIQWYEKSKYPKTYDDCRILLNLQDSLVEVLCGYEWRLISNFQKLLLCRDAYWKIAGDEMGLYKPWEPDWNHNTEKYVIYPYQYLYSIDKENYRNTVLAFPTKEMRDAFYENFKDLIEKCKELL